MTLQFTTYDEATEYFGIKLPRKFVDNILIINNFCKTEQLDPFDSLFDMFGILRIEGNGARYQQTPIELFPFGSIGSDGIHYGFVIHTTHDNDYPAGEICPMDDDGVVLISNNSTDLFQNLLCDNSFFDRYPTLLNQLGLTRNSIDRKKYDRNEKPLRVTIQPKNGWTFMDTKDGVGVFAECKYFNNYHQTKYNTLNRLRGIEEYQDLANEMKNLGFYASQLYYLKELYWYEWTNLVFAKELLTQMLEPYEKLNRQHLYDTAKWTIETFTRRYGE